MELISVVEVACFLAPRKNRARWDLRLVPTPLEESNAERWLLYGEQRAARIREVRRI